MMEVDEGLMARRTFLRTAGIVGALVKDGKLLVAGGVYNLDTGLVTPVPL